MPHSNHGTMVAVGQVFPDPGIALTQSTGWDPDGNWVFIVQPHLSREEIEAWGPLDRIYLTRFRSQIVMLLDHTGSGEVEVPAARHEGTDMPEWVTDPSGTHLLIKVIYIDSITGIVQKIHPFTLSPRSTDWAIRTAKEAWSDPVSPSQATMDYLAFQRARPTLHHVRAAAGTICRPGD